MFKSSRRFIAFVPLLQCVPKYIGIKRRIKYRLRFPLVQLNDRVYKKRLHVLCSFQNVDNIEVVTL